MAEVALTSPLAREGAALRQQRVYMSAVLSAVLLALALVAVSTLDGSSTAVAPLVLTGAGAPGNTDIEDADISQEDEEQAIENMQAFWMLSPRRWLPTSAARSPLMRKRR